MSDKPTEKALQEFLSEAQEIVEAFNRSLLKLDEDRGAGRSDPEVVNDAFRAVHSLKGLSGLFGVSRMTNLSHNLEDLLDGLRLGKVELTPEILDLLFEAVELFHRIVADTGAGVLPEGPEGSAVEDLIIKLDRAALRRDAKADEPAWGGYELDPSLLSVLTEYEEHRLRENVKSGRALFRIHAAFDLLTIDKGLEELKQRIKPVAEVITYLPSTESRDDQKIELDIIVGASANMPELAKALEGLEVTFTPVPRSERGSGKARARRTPVPAARVEAPAAATQPPQPAQPVATATAAQQPPQHAAGMHREVAGSGSGSGAGSGSGSGGGAGIGGGDDDRLSSLKSVSQTVRVDIRKLDHLMNIVGELGLARAGIHEVLDELKLDRQHAELARTLHRELRTLGRKLDELQAAILEVRMVPLGQVFDKLSRVVRKISRDAGKEIRFVISGGDTELDKLIVEELSDPLMHVIRNCIDHGIEPAQTRATLGKPEAGTVAVAAEQRGNHVVIEIEDDGAGLDEQALVRKAVDRGYLDEVAARELSRREIFNLIFLPGVSTKDVATAMSGRGVGMDVVKTNISRLSGIIDVESEPGRGTRLTFTLPITLAIIQALVIRSAGRTYAVPLNSVLESLLVRPDEIRTIERREVITLRGTTLPIVRVEEAFQLQREGPAPAKMYVVVVGMAQHRVGLVVDELVGQQDIVIKSLGRALDGIPGVAGATELGGQQTVLVLDVAALVEETLSTTMIEAVG